MKRYSLVYLLKDQYQHIGFTDRTDAEGLLRQLLTDSKRVPIGIYDAKTELFDWAPSYKAHFDQASTEEQASRGNSIITIAQSLRRRDSSWHPADGFRRPSFFA
ncbi:hypothetical protein [uncultured Fibrella sp.]|uniref:hypothetical protein n=1 Tax=uncultured Fibrella sp. TaxID=1284596 RepID=UPI0035C94FEE